MAERWPGSHLTGGPESSLGASGGPPRAQGRPPGPQAKLDLLNKPKLGRMTFPDRAENLHVRVKAGILHVLRNGGRRRLTGQWGLYPVEMGCVINRANRAP